MNPHYKQDVLTSYKLNRTKGRTALNALRTARYEAKYHPRSHSRALGIMPHRYEAYEDTQITQLPNGWKIKVEFQHDQDSGPPWEDCDGMGVIKESRGHPGEAYQDWILDQDRNWYRYYDWKETLPEAIRDGWNTAAYNFRTDRERAMAAMKSTYEYLRRWCNDAWNYVGMIVTLLDENDEELAEESCWGFESDCMDYLCEQARSWAAGMIREERQRLRDERRAAERELYERLYWAERDVVTV